MDTNIMIHRSILLYVLLNNIIIQAIVTITEPAFTGIPNSMSRAIAPPRISARDVDILASIAELSMGREKGLRIYLFVASAKHRPVTIPKWATLCCIMMSIMEENVTTQSSAYPKEDPAARLVAQLPGSIKPTVTRSPGPMYLRRSMAPECVL